MSKHRFTARRIAAAMNAITAMLAGEEGEGDWLPDITAADLEGAAAALRALAPAQPEPVRRWHYHSVNMGGNLHHAAQLITREHPDWDVVAMETAGNYTVVVWREERP